MYRLVTIINLFVHPAAQITLRRGTPPPLNRSQVMTVRGRAAASYTRERRLRRNFIWIFFSAATAGPAMATRSETAVSKLVSSASRDQV
jgi:hypothetical protein